MDIDFFSMGFREINPPGSESVDLKIEGPYDATDVELIELANLIIGWSYVMDRTNNNPEIIGIGKTGCDSATVYP